MELSDLRPPTFVWRFAVVALSTVLLFFLFGGELKRREGNLVGLKAPWEEDWSTFSIKTKKYNFPGQERTGGSTVAAQGQVISAYEIEEGCTLLGLDLPASPDQDMYFADNTDNRDERLEAVYSDSEGTNWFRVWLFNNNLQPKKIPIGTKLPPTEVFVLSKFRGQFYQP